VKKTILGLLAVFCATQAVTLAIVDLVTVPSPDSPGGREPRIRYLEGGDTIASSLYIYVFLMACVGFIAVAMKLGLAKTLFRNLESAIVFVSLFLLLQSVYPQGTFAWLAVAAGVAGLKRLYAHWLLATGLSILTAATVGAIMGMNLSIVPVIALMGYLSVYDVIAVRFSKHMSLVAESVRGSRSTFLIEMPGMESAVGISDLAVPSMFVASCALTYSAMGALWVALGGAFGLGFAIVVSDKKGMVPAIPFVFAGSMATYLAMVV